MDTKINTNISKEFKETSITINAPELTDEIHSIVKYKLYDILFIITYVKKLKNCEIYAYKGKRTCKFT